MVAQFALKPHLLLPRACGTVCVECISQMASLSTVSIAVLTSELAATIDVDGTDRDREGQANCLFFSVAK